ncbi:MULTISPECIES: sigma-54 interaction domain-containing protein [Cytobacillus]|jgi:transcriptional regulator with PAS, ATPase and Fis domain|uniref:sigma-54 interaction domain-containing protein n=1 Tax=Cytobacillus TaxID=2675230 RepID=UPI0020422B8E|nr:sigma 54-interacting transcriptional regulator [Cytobacillus oceanisediminis]MBY0158918.1 sigma 54-interacting transcriptional regulator [Cytobacillus firmus]MCM3242612.1 sigma 54-interacting transcriptional regulator [Cytobacillus oceanisediminis]MCM3392900.1 sigma 54-interacting transcriptional regulator [Cytobacillus oceanisediminis]MCM3530084.1 sigma 54-interacting transcriptional regulator [Cytobacillus oceanisediminis]MCS0823338.1 sigma 54-interacting transcriptional regulator [Cytoba
MKSAFFDLPVKVVETIVENAFGWLVVVNKEGTIIYINKNYCNFLETEREKALGKHVSEVIENSRMHIVAESGKEEIADLQYIRGNYMIANRIPIFSDGEVIGAFGTVFFRDTKEWMQMNSHVKSMLTKIQSFIQEIDPSVKYSLDDILGNSSQIHSLKEKVKMVAASDISVLIRGESGTGKELFAHSIHQLSNRSHQPFVKINCGAIPEHLLESELFGYEEGAFTGAKKGGKKGKFQLADGGTLFLDEIGDMPLNMQVKLLRALQEGEIESVGSTSPVKVDVRIIAATNRPLEKMMEEKRFREDLFYRINVVPFMIPSLRDRMEDLSLLIDSFIKKITKKSGKRISAIEDEVIEKFHQYSWPGNIRELENVIEASIHLTSNESITTESLPDYMKESAVYPVGKKNLKDILEETEKRILTQSLSKYNHDRLEAAKALGISKSSMYEKLKKYGIE